MGKVRDHNIIYSAGVMIQIYLSFCILLSLMGSSMGLWASCGWSGPL